MYIHISYLLTGIAREVGDVNRHGVQHSHDTRSTLVENTASNCRETLILHGIGIAGNTNLVTESVHDRGIVSTSAKTCQGKDHEHEGGTKKHNIVDVPLMVGIRGSSQPRM